MPLQTLVDAFNIGTGAVSSTVVRTGYGFQPKACVYWWSGRTESAATFGRRAVQGGIGIAASPTQRACSTVMSRDAFATSGTAYGVSQSACIRCITTASVLGGEANLQSFDANGQTLVITNQFTTDLRIHCLPLGGSDLTNAAVVAFQLRTTPGLQDITTVGFQPTALLLLTASDSAAPPQVGGGANPSVGLATSSAAQGTLGWHDRNGVSPSVTNRYHVGSECLATLVFGGIAIRVAFDSFLPAGFRVNVVTQTASDPIYVFALALAGPQMQVGNFLTVTSATTIAETGIGFPPKAVVLLSTCTPVSTAGTADAQATQALGAFTSPTNRACQSFVVNNGASSTVCASSVNEDACLRMLTNGTTSAGVVDAQSLDSDGFTVVMDVADVTTQKYVTYLALGDALGAPAVPPPRARVLTQAPVRAAFH